MRSANWYLLIGIIHTITIFSAAARNREQLIDQVRQERRIKAELLKESTRVHTIFKQTDARDIETFKSKFPYLFVNVPAEFHRA